MPDTFKTKACVGTAFLLDGIGRVLGWWNVSPLRVRLAAQACNPHERTRVVTL
jgi:hypothetical protein